jgi:hypothetical protein
MHMYLKSAQPWVLPAANAECYAIGPSDYQAAAKAWRAMWPEFFP